MDNKQDQPPAYGAPQAPPPTFQGQPQPGYYPPGNNMDYYGGQPQGGQPQGGQPQGGPYPPQQPGQYPPGQYGQPGYPPQGYPPQGYPPQGQYQEDRGSSGGCLGALVGLLACCCCLDILF